MPRLLAIDTTTGACSAALTDMGTGAVLAALYEPMARGHAEALAPMVQAVMASADLPMSAVSRLAVTTGPGTFTGCRIGLAFARTLGAALGIPVTGISTLQAIAAPLFDTADAASDIAAVMDARRGEVYLQCFAPDGATRAPAEVLPVKAAVAALAGRQFRLAGTGADVLLAAGPDQADAWQRTSAPDFPDARHVAALAAKLPVPDAMPEPLYLRAPDAKLPANKPNLRA